MGPGFCRPIDPPSKQKVYTLVCIDYMTKWVEATALVRAIDQVVMDFMFEVIFTRSRVPKEIVKRWGTIACIS